MAANQTVDITIPGVAYYECFDPLASGMAKDLGLPTAEARKAGRGWRMTYRGITVEQARDVARHLTDMGELWLNNSDPSYDAHERTHYRTLIKTGEAIFEQVGRA